MLPVNIDWKSEDSFIFLNPRLPQSEKEQFQFLAKQFSQVGHIWMSSSGSSKAEDESAKLIALSKQAILTAAESVNSFLQSSGDDHWLNPLPVFHIGGLSIFARAFLSGSKVTDFSSSKWNPHQLIQVIQSEKITLTSLVPTQVYDLVEANLSCPSGLRAILVGGAALSPGLYRKARDLGWPLLPSFGMTETCAVLACAPLSSLTKQKFPSLQVLSHVQVKLSSEKKLMVCGKSLLTGFAQVKKNEAVWVQPMEAGWLLTDDFAEVTASAKETFLQPLGRGQDYVKIKGEGVNLAMLRIKLEEIIAQKFSEYQQQIVLRSRTTERDLNELALVCEKSIPESAAKSIQASFNEAVMPYERILQVQFVDQIPRTALGKVDWHLF